MLVAGELGELAYVIPDPLIRGVEQMGAVLVYLYTRLRLRLGVGVTPDVVAALDDEHPLVELGCGTLGDSEAEKPGSDDDQIELLVFSAVCSSHKRLIGGHVQSGYWTGTTSP
ncbi:Uncharacterised protein [Mycobacteroides abscessus subsp. abscessus]|nr:Uncharacterised protein [Mycobacteroides abscessus subsp. abscessus]